jgi:hypothetical protein
MPKTLSSSDYKERDHIQQLPGFCGFPTNPVTRFFIKREDLGWYLAEDNDENDI